MSFKGTSWRPAETDKKLSSFSHEMGRASKFPRHRAAIWLWQGIKKGAPCGAPMGRMVRLCRACMAGACAAGYAGERSSPAFPVAVLWRVCPHAVRRHGHGARCGAPPGACPVSGRSVPDRPTPVRPWAVRVGAASRDAAGGSRHPAAACGSCSGWAARSA